MKNIIVTIILLVVVSLNCFSNSNLSNSMFIDEYFLTYQRSDPWKVQKHWLFNFAISLKKNPETIGYIGFETSEKESSNKAKAHMSRCVKYLVETEKIKRNRIIVSYIGKSKNPQIILQPVPKGVPFHF